MSDNAAQLKTLLQDIFADDIVEPKERETLAKFTEQLSNEETLEVFQTFLKEKWGEATQDGVVTAQERRLLAHIMEELGLGEGAPAVIRNARTAPGWCRNQSSSPSSSAIQCSRSSGRTINCHHAKPTNPVHTVSPARRTTSIQPPHP